MRRPSFEIIAVIVGVVLLVAIGFGRQMWLTQEQPSVYSSYDTGLNGYRALYEVLSQEQVPVERVEREITLMQNTEITGEPPVGTLIVSSTVPEMTYQTIFSPPLDRADLRELRTLVRNGMHLVFLDAKGLQRFTQASPKIFGDSTKAATYHIGKGVVTVLTTPEIFSNRNLARGTNAKFAYTLLSGNGAVGFYERVHGYVADKSFWEALPPPVHAAVWITVAIVVLGLIGANIRFAPPVPIDPPDERDSSAYLSGMASLLRRSRAVKGPLAQEDAIELSWVLAGTAPGDAALVRAAILNARLRKETE